MKELIMAVPRFTPGAAGEPMEARLEVCEAYLLRLSEELEYLIGLCHDELARLEALSPAVMGMSGGEEAASDGLE